MQVLREAVVSMQCFPTALAFCHCLESNEVMLSMLAIPQSPGSVDVMKSKTQSMESLALSSEPPPLSPKLACLKSEPGHLLNSSPLRSGRDLKELDDNKIQHPTLQALRSLRMLSCLANRMGIVLRGPEDNSPFTGSFIYLPHFGNSNLGRLSHRGWENYKLGFF